MAEASEECELQQLVTQDDSKEDKSDETPPAATSGISKITQTSPPTPMSNKLSGSSVRASQSSSVKMNKAGTQPSSTKLLYVNEKLNQGQSVRSDSSSRLGRERPSASRVHHPKRAFFHFERADRPGTHHSFLSDVTDVRRMEQALLQLLEDFHSGKLRAFGKDCSMEQMEAIREQQERLAKLHFDLGAQQELYPPLSDEGLRAGQENMQSLMECLEQLSLSIERLHSFSSDSRESSILGLIGDS